MTTCLLPVTCGLQFGERPKGNESKTLQACHVPLTTYGAVPQNVKAPGAPFICTGVYKEIGVYACGVRLSLWPPCKGSLCQVSYSAGVRKWEWTGSGGSSSGRRLLIKLRKPSRKFFKSENHTSQIKAPSTDGSSPLPDFNSEGNSLCCRLYSSLSHCY